MSSSCSAVRAVAYMLTGHVPRATANAVISSGMRPHGLLEGARLPAAQCNTRELYPNRGRDYVAERSMVH